MDYEERERKIKMMADLILQVILILVAVFMFSLMYKIPQKFIRKLRYRNKSDLQARRHFVVGAQLLAQARSSKDRSAVSTIAKSAAEEAEKSIALDPKDAAAHILKALALDLQGFKTSAIDAIDVALSPLAVGSLADEERGDALFKRAELKLGLSRRGRVDSVVDDLVASVKLKGDNGKAFYLLGECYECKEMREEAVKAYEGAVRVDPNYKPAQEALDRLGS